MRVRPTGDDEMTSRSALNSATKPIGRAGDRFGEETAVTEIFCEVPAQSAELERWRLEQFWHRGSDRLSAMFDSTGVYR